MEAEDQLPLWALPDIHSRLGIRYHLARKFQPSEWTWEKTNGYEAYRDDIAADGRPPDGIFRNTWVAENPQKVAFGHRRVHFL